MNNFSAVIRYAVWKNVARSVNESADCIENQLLGVIASWAPAGNQWITTRQGQLSKSTFFGTL